ncbi:Proteasome subunit beta type-4 [Clavispora lusitaniae]|nr:Proteasome subunit beta type-4 [Clavispora lusitaniae]
MDIILGIRVQGATLIATSKAATRGISILKDTDDKTRVLNPHNLVAYTGESGDTVQFAEYVQANIQLYTMRENHELSPQATASFVRNQLATSIRSRKPYQVNVLIGGYDTKTGAASLNWIDYLGTQAESSLCVHGYAASLNLRLFCLTAIHRADIPVGGRVGLRRGLKTDEAPVDSHKAPCQGRRPRTDPPVDISELTRGGSQTDLKVRWGG